MNHIIILIFIMINHSLSKTIIHTPLAIVGAGTAGIALSSRLIADTLLQPHQIRIFDASNIHHYNSSWTLLGAGYYQLQKTYKPTDQLIPKGVVRTPQNITSINPNKNLLLTTQGDQFAYDQLVIATGIDVDFQQIKGAIEALEDPQCPVASVYHSKYAVKMNRLVSAFKSGGNVIFTEAPQPIKCPGAPQKMVYLITDKFRREKKTAKYDFHKANQVLFGIPEYAKRLNEIVEERGINLYLQSNLVEIKKDERIAVFENFQTKERTEKKFDLLHIVPPQKAPQMIRNSGLDDGSGFLNVNGETLQHMKWNNIWGIGDSSNFATSKTAAGIMEQNRVLCNNMMNSWKGQEMNWDKYDGYTCCPIFTTNKSVLLCEFKYKGEVTSTFGRLQKSDNYWMYLLKSKVFPFAYWRLMTKGLWDGRNGVRWFK